MFYGAINSVFREKKSFELRQTISSIIWFLGGNNWERNVFNVSRLCFMGVESVSWEWNIFHENMGSKKYRFSAMALKCNENQRNIVVCRNDVLVMQW